MLIDLLQRIVIYICWLILKQRTKSWLYYTHPQQTSNCKSDVEATAEGFDVGQLNYVGYSYSRWGPPFVNHDFLLVVITMRNCHSQPGKRSENGGVSSCETTREYSNHFTIHVTMILTSSLLLIYITTSPLWLTALTTT